MTTITVRTQAELDQAISDKADVVYIDSGAGVWLDLITAGSSRVVAWGSSRVVARGSSSVEARGSSSVEARDSSRVEAWDSSSVEARDSSRVEAWDSSSVVARGSSRVEAWDSSSVVARGSSSVEARDSSRVEAWDSSRVVARGSSRVEAWDSSSVEARDSSRVAAGNYVAVHLHSQHVTLTGGVVIDMTELDLTDPRVWCEFHGVTVTESKSGEVAYLYKAVNDEWTTDRGTEYSPGTLPEAPDWDPTAHCGQGLHFGASPSHSAQYFPEATRYVRVGVLISELVPLGDKAKARRVVVPCVEVDRVGEVPA